MNVSTNIYTVDFCQAIGFDVIQMLPLHDNNTDNSPFSPVSCFALHPLFITLTKLPNADKQTQEMSALISQLQDLNTCERVQWKKGMHTQKGFID